MRLTRYALAIVILFTLVGVPLSAQEPTLTAFGECSDPGRSQISLSFNPAGGKVAGSIMAANGDWTIAGTLEGSRFSGMVHTTASSQWSSDTSIEGVFDLAAGRATGEIPDWGVEWEVTWESSAARDATPTSAAGPDAAPSAAPTAQGKPLCEEALANWPGVAPTSANLLLGLEDLGADFEAAIQRYNEEAPPEEQAVARYHMAGSITAGLWLFSGGGTGFERAFMSKERGRDFVFLAQEDVAAVSAYKPLQGIGKSEIDLKKARKVVKPGSEAALKLAIIERYRASGQPLSPGEVFYLALKERAGDAQEALLLAHNLLRSVARGTDEDFTGLRADAAFVDKYLQVIRQGDNGGPWYHFFGTAYFEMVDRDGSVANTAGIAPGAGEGMRLREVSAELARLAASKDWSSEESRTALSRLANWYEQFQRETMEGRAADPEKYCINIWGAKLGAWLIQKRLPVVGNPLLAPIRIDGKALQQREQLVNPLNIEIAMSPVDMRWEGEGYTLVLGQRAESLAGDFPIRLVPFYEAGSQTWGAAWSPPHDQAYKLTCRAVQGGTLHLVRIRRDTGQVAVYLADVREGEELTMEVAPGEDQPALRRADGTAVEPQMTSLDPAVAPPVEGTPASPAGGLEDLKPRKPGSGSAGDAVCGLLVLGGLCLAGLGALAVVLLVVRRAGRKRAAPAHPPAGTRTPVGQGPLPPATAAAPPAPAAPAPPPAAPKSAAAHPPAPQAFCTACGRRLEPGAAFCAGCGAKVIRSGP